MGCALRISAQWTSRRVQLRHAPLSHQNVILHIDNHVANMSSLRSILGGGKVKKKKSASSSSTPRKSSSSSLSSWPRTKPSSASSSKSLGSTPDNLYDSSLPLPSHGPRQQPATVFRTVPEALHHAQSTIFDPLPESHAGMGSVRTATVLNYRASLPPVASVPHITALLSTSGANPTAVAREIEQTIRSGQIRKIIVPRRGGMGETLIPTSELESLVSKAQEKGLIDQATKSGFLSYLRSNPGSTRIPRTIPAPDGRGLLLDVKQTDALIRAGFLTAQSGQNSGDPVFGFSRPEDKYTLMSLETVSRAASGSLFAVGGSDVIHASGGTGIPSSHDTLTSQLSLAIPGNGTFLKLVSAAVGHLVSLLEKATYREMPVSALRDRWNGGIAGDAASLAKRSRGEFVGILPGRTKKWRDFYGLRFEWVLDEALGAGVVEGFETGSVGRGVRLV